MLHSLLNDVEMQAPLFFTGLLLTRVNMCKSLNVEQLSDMQIVEDLVLLSCNESDVEVKQAMALEIENWKYHNVYL